MSRGISLLICISEDDSWGVLIMGWAQEVTNNIGISDVLFLTLHFFFIRVVNHIFVFEQ